jgi:serine/threonine protein kinase
MPYREGHDPSMGSSLPEQKNKEKRHIASSYAHEEGIDEEQFQVISHVFDEQVRALEQKDVLGEGGRAKVYADFDGPHFKKLALKINLRERDKKFRDQNSTLEEFRIHEKIYGLLQEWPERFGKSIHGRYINKMHIPRPIGYIESENNDGIIMERVKGKTLYRIMCENYFKDFMRRDSRLVTISDEKLQEAESLSDNLYERFMRITMRDAHREWSHDRMMKVATQEPILTPEQFEALKAFIALANREKFYHGDLHFNNVMIDNEYGGVYIIDFGKSVDRSKEEAPKQRGDEFQLGVDQAFLHELRKIGNGEADSRY